LLIGFVEDNKRPLWQGIGIAVLLSVTAIIQSIVSISVRFTAKKISTQILNRYFHMMMRFGMNLRATLTAAVFTKVLQRMIRIVFMTKSLIVCSGASLV
jgi:Zn-dependent membrane protease YugP